jgi:hypothetical protein
MKLKKNITLAEQERCDGDMMSISVLKNSRVSNPAIFSKNFASGSIPSISKNYLTQFNLHSLPILTFYVTQDIIKVLFQFSFTVDDPVTIFN